LRIKGLSLMPHNMVAAVSDEKLFVVQTGRHHVLPIDTIKGSCVIALQTVDPNSLARSSYSDDQSDFLGIRYGPI